MKVCCKCLQEKPYESFHKRSALKDGRKAWCKSCDKQYREANKEKLLQKAKDSYHNKTDCEKRTPALQRKYGITHQDYLNMLQDQDGQCAVCGLPEENNHKGRLCVDHNHHTGKVRGLLCHNCNRSLGLLGDDVEVLYNLYKYKVHHDGKA